MHDHVHGPSRRPFKSVLVMQPTQNRRRRDSMANRKIVTTKLLGHPLLRWIRNAWPEAGVWSATSVPVAAVDVAATMDTLLGHDVGDCLPPPDPPCIGAFARRAPARSAGPAAPTAGTATHAAWAVAARESGLLAG